MNNLKALLAILMYFNAEFLSSLIVVQKMLQFFPFVVVFAWRLTSLYFGCVIKTLLWPRSILLLILSFFFLFKSIWDVFLLLFIFSILFLTIPSYVVLLLRKTDLSYINTHHFYYAIKILCSLTLYNYLSFTKASILCVVITLVDWLLWTRVKPRYFDPLTANFNIFNQYQWLLAFFNTESSSPKRNTSSKLLLILSARWKSWATIWRPTITMKSKQTQSWVQSQRKSNYYTSFTLLYFKAI